MKISLSCVTNSDIGRHPKFKFRKSKIYYCLFGMMLFSPFELLSAQPVDLNENKSSLRRVLENISKQSKMDLIGDISMLKNTKSVTIKVKSEEVETVLDRISASQPVLLKVVNGAIVVKSKVITTKPTVVSSSGTNIQQDYILQGKVVGEDGKAIAGVTVVLIGTNVRAVTDAKGLFSIKVQANSKLKISFIGCKDQIIEVNARRIIGVTLADNIGEIEESVVTGYTRVNRESFTGAARTITRQELEKFNNNNIFSILQALDPAFKVGEANDFGSNPNVLPEINIRGVASVGAYAVNAPLVVMDGFEVALTTLYDLDVNRIESISILKDASSTSMYGSRGSNGVIVIETRLPKDGKFTITYDAKPSVTLVDLSDYNMMNAKEKLEYETLAGIYNVSPFDPNDPWDQMTQEMYNNLYAERVKNVESGVDTYWLSQPVRSTFSVNHSVRMEGGANDVRYSLEGNYNDFKGVMKESGRVRAGAGFNLIYRLRDKITFNNKATYQYTKAYNSPYGSFQQYVNMNPYERMRDDNGDYIIRYSELGTFYSFGPTIYNPLYNTGLGFRDDNTSHFISNNMLIDWTINPALRLRARGVISRTILDTDNYLSPFHSNFFGITDQTRKGMYAIRNGSETQYNANLAIEYNKNFNKHQIFANAVAEVRSDDENSKSYRVTGFNDDRFMTPSIALQYAANSVPETVSNPRQAVGFLGSLLYTYDNRYVFNGSLRSDGSSLFGEENRFGTFWSLGTSYNVHNEKWFNKSVFNRLRFFANYGTNGSESFNGDMLNTAYRFVSGKYYYKQYSSIYSNQGNPSVSWPISRQVSVGTNIGLFKDLIGLDLNYYRKVTDNMISNITVAPSFGFYGDSYVQNLGRVSNTGFEINLNLKVYENTEKEISWYLAVGAVQNRSKLLELSNELKLYNESLIIRDASGNISAPSRYYEQGASLSVIRGVPSLGIDPANGRELFLDRNGNETYTWSALDQKVIGNGEADLFGNISTTFNYQRLSVQLIGNYSIGQDVYNQTLVNKVENNSPFYNADKRVLEDRWKNPGDETLFKSISDQSVTQVSSRFIQNELLFRLNSLNVNYDFSKALLSKYNLQRLRLNFSTNDMVRFSTVRMERGTDYPFARTYNFGVMVQF